MTKPHPHHDKGLEFDLSTLLSRRRTLGVLLGSGAAAALAACTPGTEGGSATPSGTSSATVTPSESTTAAASPSSQASSTVTRAFAELENENYLRGVQEADANGQLTFSTIFPGAYMGRWPHIHFEVFESMSNTSAAGQVLAVSQIALTESACKAVYATDGYENSARSFPKTTLTSDNVFGDDGGIYQLATISGSVQGGYTAALNVTV